MFNSFKTWLQDNKEKITTSVLLLLIISISFGLGYLVAKDSSRAPIIIEKSGN
ncbi:MAG: hypothetical protein Q8O87_01885 [bacterium]|nr:hypothetical protein [bacterium]